MAASIGVAAESGRREQAKEERRLRIIASARDLIRETGETDLSMRALAERAGVSVATAYNLFGSKRAVVLSVLEDERDYLERFAKLDPGDPIARIFSVHELSFSYYTADPDFYRTLWRSLLNTSQSDETGLASIERLARTQAIWFDLLATAVKDDCLRADPGPALLLESLAQVTGGALLGWATGSLPTRRLTASVGFGYSQVLLGSATEHGRPSIQAANAAYAHVLRDNGVAPGLRSAEMF
ncbi:MAG: TetR/AcrR family transcriptional regulator [Pacificimonas sp.]|jgi:AcrR family transcriptional regulator|nr:TetR/AcrR family transcriptional regulator [Pacificimonas sp.]